MSRKQQLNHGPIIIVRDNLLVFAYDAPYRTRIGETACSGPNRYIVSSSSRGEVAQSSKGEHIGRPRTNPNGPSPHENAGGCLAQQRSRQWMILASNHWWSLQFLGQHPFTKTSCICKPGPGLPQPHRAALVQLVHERRCKCLSNGYPLDAGRGAELDTSNGSDQIVRLPLF